MSRKSIDQLVAQADVALSDNDVGAISPADVRAMIRDFLDTVTPTYGGMQIQSAVQPVNQTPANLIFQSEIASFPPEWMADTAAGTLSRTPDVPAMTCRFTMNGDVVALGGDITVALYANGVATGWQSTVTTMGPTNRATFGFGAVVSITEPTTFELKVSSSKATSFTFQNVLFLGENIAVRDFTAPAVKMQAAV